MQQNRLIFSYEMTGQLRVVPTNKFGERVSKVQKEMEGRKQKKILKQAKNRLYHIKPGLSVWSKLAHDLHG